MHPDCDFVLEPTVVPIDQSEAELLEIFCSRKSAGRATAIVDLKLTVGQVTRRKKRLADKQLITISKNGSVRVTADGWNARERR